MNWYNIRRTNPDKCCGSFFTGINTMNNTNNFITNLICALKARRITSQHEQKLLRNLSWKTHHDHSHCNRSKLIKARNQPRAPTNSIECNCTLTNAFPCFPVRNTRPFPRAAIHALSRPFGSTYIASSPRRCFASMRTERPASNPPSQNDALDTSAASSHAGTCFRPTSARCEFCAAQ
jgi:hypothetical protein